jgi:hypothetical protein
VLPVAGGTAPNRVSGLSGPGGPSAGDVAVASGLGAWSDDGSVVFAPPPDELDTTTGPDLAIQRSADGLTSLPGPSSGPVPTTVTVLDAQAEPTVQLAAAAGGGGGGAGAGTSETELDELAKRLYGRMRLQLRRELILDRERSGSLIDLPR